VPITGCMNPLFAPNHPWQAPEAASEGRASSLRLVSSGAAAIPPAPLAPPATDAPQFTWTPVAHEEAIVAALDRSALPHELASEAFRRKEHEVGALFALLTAADALQLDRRLSVSAPADPIASRFARLVPERRTRLITFLRDARRRTALSKSRSR